MSAFQDLHRLRSFVVIVERGSISAGARELSIPQPTLSRHLQELEAQCRVPLLHRDTRRMSLTPTGERFLADAQAMLLLADEAGQRLRAEHEVLAGHLRIFATIDCGQAIVTRLLSSFLSQHPQVTAALSLTNRPLQMIEERCDMGIVPGRITDERVVARPAGLIKLCLTASPILAENRPKTKNLAGLKGWPWIALAGPQFWSAREIRLFARKGVEQRLQISPVLVSEGVTSVREAARVGLGVALLPEWMIKEDLEAGRLVKVLPQWRAKPLPIHVVYHGKPHLPVRIRAFVDFAVAGLQQELG